MLEPAPDLTSRCVAELVRLHGVRPVWAARAPGRVNVIGEHTDYLGGRCLPLTLPYATWVAAAPRTDDEVRLTSRESGRWTGAAATHLGVDAVRPAGWAAYVLGALNAVGHRGGIDLHVESSVPLGAGLSSSAALICAVTTAISDLSPEGLLSPSTWAEQVAVGAPTGGMDQYAALCGVAGHVLLLDFASSADVSARPTPWRPEDAGVELLAVDTGTRHAHGDGQFAQRRREGEAAMATERPTGTLARRRRHVESENARVDAVVAAAQVADWRAVGTHLTASHLSLRDEYEVSAPALDAAVEAALSAGAWGARMTGGGFGGSVVVLSEVRDRSRIVRAVTDHAREETLPAPRFLAANASGPATRVGVTGP